MVVRKVEPVLQRKGLTMGSLSKISRRALVKCGLVSAGLPVVAKLLSSASTARAQTPAKNDQSFAAVPGQVGGQDVFGAYEVDPNWPKPLSSCPEMRIGLGARRRAFSPRTLIESSFFSAVNCRT